MTRYCLIGPTYPYRGGIAHYTTLLAQHLRLNNETLLISFARQYPRWFFPGKDDKDPSRSPLQTDAEYLLDPLSPLSWRRSVNRIKKWSPDVVIIPWWVPFWAPAWSAVGRGVKRSSHQPKLIFICHNVLPHERSIVDKIALKTSLSPANGFIVHSLSDAQKLEAVFPKKKVQVAPIPTFTSLGSGSDRPAVDLPDERPILLFFGFVRPYKGLDILIDALALVDNNIRPHLVIAGEFWDSELKYIHQIQELGLESRITIHNRYLPDEELAAYVDAADVVVLPYRSATQSAIVQVAFGQGTPVITTNVGGLAEAVDDGRTGLIVPPEEPESLADAIRKYFENDLGPMFTENILMEQKRFSWDQLIAKISVLGQSS